MSENTSTRRDFMEKALASAGAATLAGCGGDGSNTETESGTPQDQNVDQSTSGGNGQTPATGSRETMENPLEVISPEIYDDEDLISENVDEFMGRMQYRDVDAMRENLSSSAEETINRYISEIRRPTLDAVNAEPQEVVDFKTGAAYNVLNYDSTDLAARAEEKGAEQKDSYNGWTVMEYESSEENQFTEGGNPVLLQAFNGEGKQIVLPKNGLQIEDGEGILRHAIDVENGNGASSMDDPMVQTTASRYESGDYQEIDLKTNPAEDGGLGQLLNYEDTSVTVTELELGEDGTVYTESTGMPTELSDMEKYGGA